MYLFLNSASLPSCSSSFRLDSSSCWSKNSVVRVPCVSVYFALSCRNMVVTSLQMRCAVFGSSKLTLTWKPGNWRFDEPCIGSSGVTSIADLSFATNSSICSVPRSEGYKPNFSIIGCSRERLKICSCIDASRGLVDQHDSLRSKPFWQHQRGTQGEGCAPQHGQRQYPPILLEYSFRLRLANFAISNH